MAAHDKIFDMSWVGPILDQCGGEGASTATLAERLGVNKCTVFKWKKAYPEFAEAYEWYRTRAESYWSIKAGKVAIGEIKGDAKLLQHRLASQFQEGGEWSAPSRTELTGKDGGPIETKLDESQVDARIAALLAAHPELKDTK